MSLLLLKLWLPLEQELFYTRLSLMSVTWPCAHRIKCLVSELLEFRNNYILLSGLSPLCSLSSSLCSYVCFFMHLLLYNRAPQNSVALNNNGYFLILLILRIDRVHSDGSLSLLCSYCSDEGSVWNHHEIFTHILHSSLLLAVSWETSGCLLEHL